MNGVKWTQTAGGYEATVTSTGVSLNKSSMTLTEDSTEKLTATITPSNATNKGLDWALTGPPAMTR